MRFRAALLVPACAAALVGGCHPAAPPPDLSLDPGQLLAQVREAGGAVQSAQGEARLKIRSSRGSGTVRQFTAAERPDRVHLEELDFFGNPAAVLVAAGGRFALYDARKKVLYRGAATPANLARLVPLPMAAGDLVAVLLGTAPLSGDPVSVERGRGRLRLRLLDGDAALDLFVGPKALVEEFARAVAGGAGPGSYEVEFSQRAERGGVAFPLLMSLRSAPAHLEADLEWTEVKVNEPLDPSLFELTPPRGSRIVEVGQGGTD
ncbi:MAG TPA: DUF4292 domain-containing protein [Anaeromyxobacter sp.]|nr:DUF4292 domain-containing protein [Anaeromyxobacter sp.]